MNVDELHIKLGPRDKFGRRRIEASDTEGVYTGTFDPHDDGRREKFAQDVEARFDGYEWHEVVDMVLDAAYRADREDAQTDTSNTTICPPIQRKGSLREIIERHPKQKPYVIDGLLREGETCNVIAAPKVGKSWFVYYVALSIVMGWSLFGKFCTAAGKVLIVDNELHPETLASRIPVVAEAMQVDPFGGNDIWLDDLEIWPLRGDLRSLNELTFEFDTIEHGAYKLIVFDAKYRFGNGESENDNAAEAQFYNQIDRIAAQTGAAIMLVHHSSKGNQSGKSVVDVGAGAGAQSRAADCHLVLREHEEEHHVVLDAVARSFPPPSPLVLRWEWPLWQPVEGMDPEKLAGTKTKQQQQWSEDNDAADKEVIKALLDGPATNRALRESTGMSRERIQRSLDRLKSAGHIDYTTTKIRGNECREYFIADSPV